MSVYLYKIEKITPNGTLLEDLIVSAKRVIGKMHMHIMTSIETDKAPSVIEGSVRINDILEGILVTES